MSNENMSQVGNLWLPGTREKAEQLAAEQIAPIEAARDAVTAAKQALLDVCIKQYPVGSRVSVNIAARQNPTHEVVSINENGWMTLRNVQTGTERGMMADSINIAPCQCWYTSVSKGGK